jgi:5-methylthioadenosine/S-adenosylhomocysteine deaminase
MKNTILIKNVNLISLAKNAPKIQNNIDILIENEKIAKISKNIKGKFNKIIDGTNRYVIPGFINSHSHVAMGLFRNTVTGLTLQK